MKTNLKFFAVLLGLYFAGKATFAQEAQKAGNTPFLGIWELFKTASNGLPLQNYPPGYIKIYNADGTFAIIRAQNTGSIIKGSGYYAVDDDQTCREADKLEDLVKKGFKISYEFSTDKKVLTISFSYPDGAAYTEAYRKLEPASQTP